MKWCTVKRHLDRNDYTQRRESYLSLFCKCSNVLHHTAHLWTHPRCKWRKTSTCPWGDLLPIPCTFPGCRPTTRLHTIHCRSSCTDQASSLLVTVLLLIVLLLDRYLLLRLNRLCLLCLVFLFLLLLLFPVQVCINTTQRKTQVRVQLNCSSQTRGHPYKYYTNVIVCVRASYFANRVTK